MSTGDTAPIEVREAVSEHFGLRGHLTRLPSELDEIWRLEAGEQSYTVRISPPGRSVESLQYEMAVLEHLGGGAGLGFATPLGVRSLNGDLVVQAWDGHLLRVLTWVAGDPYAQRRRSPMLDRAIGEAAGALAGALGPLEARDRPEIPWDLRTVATQVAERAPSVEDPRRRRFLMETSEAVAADLATRDLRVGLVHNDLNDLNVLVDGGGRVSGIIDFGDMMRTYRAAEPAIAACYAMLGRHDPVAVGAGVITAFAGREPFAEDEAESLFSLVMGRLAMSAAQASSQRETGNPHQQVSAGPVWELLERLGAADHGWCRASLAAAAITGPAPDPPEEELAAARAARIGPSLSLAYRSPLSIVRGDGAWLSDRRGRRFLDCVNNVAHVGHGHPAVVEAAARQMRLLNTNSRYLHQALTSYAEKLLERFPPTLEVVYLVNSGTEANELAVRLARSATGRFDMAVFEHGYHGNSTTTMALSPYKFDGPGGQGKEAWVTVLPVPDAYRGAAGMAYRQDLETAWGSAAPAALLAEAHSGAGGQLVPPSGSLAAAYEVARRSGGLVIADEIQTGFGRVGEAFWAFELHGVVPDLVTLGKPIGNGHPLGAVVTTRPIAEAFDNGMEFFSTFGANPVSAVVGEAVLDVIEAEGLQQRARDVGRHLSRGLHELAGRHDAVGDVRGPGLFVGVDVVVDRTSKEPAGGIAAEVIERALSRGVLSSRDGPGRNVLKIKPPLVFSEDDADRLIEALDEALTSIG